MKTNKKLLLITAFAAISFAAFLGGCKKDDYVEVDAVCPLVLTTDPADGATNVALDKVITITFNEDMNPATITQASILLNGVSNIAGTVTSNGNTAYFTPTAPLTANTTYTGRVTTAVKDINGNSLQADYVWTFSTGATISPVVIATDPANTATGVPINKTLSATFNMAMDPLTINATTFKVMQGTTPVTGAVAYGNGNTAYFIPAGPLLLNTVYTATITTGAKNAVGTPMAANYTWTFTTGSLAAPTVISTDPANNATGVVLNKTITAAFSEVMNPLTINATTFTVKQGLTVVTGLVTYTGTVASFNPTVNLLPGTVYTATITTGAQNLAGTGLANNYVWTFTTGNAVNPIVISTDPVNNATGVALNKVVTATFNMVMDPLTLNATTFTLMQGTTPVLGVVTYSGSTASFTPAVPFTANLPYTATITTGAKSLAGTPLANNYVWTFTTGNNIAPTVILTDPLDNAVNVPLNKVITATFSMPMNPLTINFTTFKLSLGTTPVAGTITYSGSMASFTPTVNLLANSNYTATITTGAQNPAGTALANNYVWDFTTSPTLQGPVVLNTAARFGILAGVGVSNNAGFSVINNLDVGIYPGVRSSVTGFPPAIIVNGAIYASDDLTPPGTAAMLLQAKTDLTNAYLAAEAAVSPAPVTVSGDQGGLTLAPGIYKSTSTLSIANGNLTLDAQGNPNAFWIFQIASGFTTVGGAGGSVILIGGAQAKNVYWQTGSSAVIGDYTSFQGNILALTSITMNSHATAVGRMLARNGAVVMTHTNIINKP
ncbi:MAG: Ig-like domain-containing protein [Ferruginibacter sp.]